MRAASPAGGKGRIPGKAAEPRPRALGLRRRPGKSTGMGRPERAGSCLAGTGQLS